MEIFFYKTIENFELLLILLTKARSNNLTVSIYFAKDFENNAQDFSKKLWLNSDIPHGIKGDVFENQHPIFIDEKLNNKDIAIIIDADTLIDLSKYNFQKVFFINCTNQKFENAKTFEYIKKK